MPKPNTAQLDEIQALNMLSPKARRNISRIFPFGLIWLVSGWVFTIVEWAVIGGPDNLPSTVIHMDLQIFIFSSLAIMAVGLLVGTIELVYLNDVLAKKSLAKKILYKLLIYILFFFAIILITFPLAASLELNTNILDKRVWDKYFSYLTSMAHLSTLLQLGAALVTSLFYSEISDNIGHGVLINFFTGKYHKPIEENRIFLFLDMKSSTTIAEQLGHIRYFELLREYYAGMSDAIVQYAGEVYQYVGDEIIVSWKYESGIANNNCKKASGNEPAGLSSISAWRPPSKPGSISGGSQQERSASSKRRSSLPEMCSMRRPAFRGCAIPLASACSFRQISWTAWISARNFRPARWGKKN